MTEIYNLVEEVAGGVAALFYKVSKLRHETEYARCPCSCPGRLRVSHSAVTADGTSGRLFVVVSEWCELCRHQRKYLFWTTPNGTRS